MAGEPKSITVPWVAGASGRGDHLVMVTAYDHPQGRTADAAGVDVILVGDSLAMVVLGHPDTLSVTMDEMIHHTRAVRRGVKRALLVADMPYGSFHLGADHAVGNAIRFVKEAGAQAVKIEGARPELVAAMTAAEVPVMAHLGPHPAVRPPPRRLQGPGSRRRGPPLHPRRRRSRRGRRRLLARPRMRPLRPRGRGHETASPFPPSASAPAPAAPARCSSTTTSWASKNGSPPASYGATPSWGTLSREAIAQFAADVREGRFPAPEESYGGGGGRTPKVVEEPAKLYG